MSEMKDLRREPHASAGQSAGAPSGAFAASQETPRAMVRVRDSAIGGLDPNRRSALLRYTLRLLRASDLQGPVEIEITGDDVVVRFEEQPGNGGLGAMPELASRIAGALR